MAPNAPNGADAGEVPMPGAIRLKSDAIVDCCKLVAACKAAGVVITEFVFELLFSEVDIAAAVGVDSDKRPKVNGSL